MTLNHVPYYGQTSERIESSPSRVNKVELARYPIPDSRGFVPGKTDGYLLLVNCLALSLYNKFRACSGESERNTTSEIKSSRVRAVLKRITFTVCLCANFPHPSLAIIQGVRGAMYMLSQL